MSDVNDLRERMDALEALQRELGAAVTSLAGAVYAIAEAGESQESDPDPDGIRAFAEAVRARRRAARGKESA